jgi:hypothetical protein
MSLIARNSLWFARDSAFAADQMLSAGIPGLINTSPSGGMVQTMASGAMRFTCASNLTLYSAESNVSIGAFGVRDVVVVNSNGVFINGDVRVTGGVETLSTTELTIQDKVIRIAHPLDIGGAINDTDISGAGIVVGPTISSNIRAIKWFQEYDDVPSRWDVRGGGWHISRVFDGGNRVVAYGMQINDREELEFVRHEYSNDKSNDGVGGKHQSVFVLGGGAHSNVKPALNTFPFLAF